MSSEASIDSTGVIRLHAELRNKNMLQKKKVAVTLNVLNDGNVVYSLTSGNILLHGTLSSIFIPSKKSSTVVNKYGNVAFDYISMKDPNAFEKDENVRTLDKKISEVAAKVRRIKILVEANKGEQSDMHQEFSRSVEELAKLKDSRQMILRQIEQSEKFKALTLDLEHTVE